MDSEPDDGEELYPAAGCRPSRQRGRVQSDYLVFFANWQSQAGRLLFEATARPEVKDLVRAFLIELHDRIIESGFYDRVTRKPETRACVEFACGLEGFAFTGTQTESGRP